jgi:DMSO/TMAO reductase YedYZ molybdopterin-dependent catalytic subunit
MHVYIRRNRPPQGGGTRPPGGTPTARPGADVQIPGPALWAVPHFNPATWDFRVWGLVEEEKRWTWDEFNQLPRTRIQMDIHCVTRWSKFDTVWEGVSVKPWSKMVFSRSSRKPHM